jgi:hypothetical protein
MQSLTNSKIFPLQEQSLELVSNFKGASRNLSKNFLFYKAAQNFSKNIHLMTQSLKAFL